MKRWFILAALAWWVVTGYGYPPNIVAGPFSDYDSCAYTARELNRVNITYVYRCAWH